MEKSRLKSTFLPYHVKKHHSSLEMDTFKIMCEVCYRAKRDKKEAILDLKQTIFLTMMYVFLFCLPPIFEFSEISNCIWPAPSIFLTRKFKHWWKPWEHNYLETDFSYFYIEKWTFKIMCEVCYRAKRDKKEATWF